MNERQAVEARRIEPRADGREVDLYPFTKSMETINASLDDNATLILSTDSELLK